MIYLDFKALNSDFLKFVCNRSKYVSFLTLTDLRQSKFSGMNALLKSWEPYLIESYCDTEYLDSEFGETYRILVYEMNDEIKGQLMQVNDLRKWRYPPHFPEDPCFFDENVECWLKTVIHEELAMIYDERDEMIEELLSLGDIFSVTPFDSTKPRLSNREEVERRRERREKKDVAIQAEIKQIKNALEQVLSAKGFQTGERVFYRVVDKQILVMVEIETEDILFDAIPLCRGQEVGMHYPACSFSIAMYLDSKGVFYEEISTDMMINTFIEEILPQLCQVKDLVQAYQFHKIHLRQITGEDLDGNLVYIMLEQEKYEEALKVLRKLQKEELKCFKEDYEHGDYTFEELEDIKVQFSKSQLGKILELLEAKRYEVIQDMLDKNRRANLKWCYNRLF